MDKNEVNPWRNYFRKFLQSIFAVIRLLTLWRCTVGSSSPNIVGTGLVFFLFSKRGEKKCSLELLYMFSENIVDISRILNSTVYRCEFWIIIFTENEVKLTKQALTHGGGNGSNCSSKKKKDYWNLKRFTYDILTASNEATSLLKSFREN